MDDPFAGLMFPIKGTVVAPSGAPCRAPHQAGQTWLMKGVPAGICSFAFNAMFPAAWTLRFGGTNVDGDNPDAMDVTCSVPGCGAQFRLERVSDAEAEALAQEASLITLEDLAKSIPVGLSRKVR